MISESRKAIVAFVLGLLGPIAVLLASPADLDARTVASAVVAGLIVGLGTWAVPNAPRTLPAGPVI